MSAEKQGEQKWEDKVIRVWANAVPVGGDVELDAGMAGLLNCVS